MFIHAAKDKIRMLTESRFAYKLEDGQTGRVPDAKVIKRLRQMADFSFPLIQDINYLEEISCCKDLSPWQAVTATQAAIWFLLDKTEPDFNRYPYAERENLKRYYEHLILNSEYGYEDRDLEDIKKETAVKLNLSAVKQTSTDKYYLYGPCEIETSYALSRAFKYNLSAKDERGTDLCIVDNQGEEISASAAGKEFYIKLLKKKETESIYISLSGKTSYAADVSLSEPHLIINILTKPVTDAQELQLSRILIKKRSSSQGFGRLSGVEFKLSMLKTAFDEAETNEEGEAVFCNLLPGDYILQEVRAAENHIIEGDGKIRVKICAKQTVIDIVNEAVTGSISAHEQGIIRRRLFVSGRKKKFGRLSLSVHDYQHTEIRLPAAEFEIQDSQGFTLENLITNEDGRTLSEPLLCGIYKLIEKKAPEGYCALEEPILFSIDGMENKSIAISNKKHPYTKKGMFRMQNVIRFLCAKLPRVIKKQKKFF